MLTLSRKAGEAVWIEGDIRIKVNRISAGRVVLCIDAPRHLRILREEIAPNFHPATDRNDNGQPEDGHYLGGEG